MDQMRLRNFEKQEKSIDNSTVN